MQVTMIAVVTKNENLFRGKEQGSRSPSKEDQDIFYATREKYPVFIMGSNTYNEVKDSIIPSKEHLRIILTKSPDKYERFTIRNQIEFTDMQPNELIADLESRGYPSALVLGGSEIYTLFLNEHCIDEVRITREPFTYNTGLPMRLSALQGVHLTEHSSIYLNDDGTVHTIYKVEYSS